MVMCALFGGGGEIMIETPPTLFEDDTGDGYRMKAKNGNPTQTICADGIHGIGNVQAVMEIDDGGGGLETWL